MTFLKRIKNVDDAWFYSRPPRWALWMSIFVKGDALVVVPAILGIVCIGLFSVRYMLLSAAVAYTVRSFGEILYWMSQQFYKKTYRPDDFGLNQLGNDAIYILYQLVSQLQLTLGIVGIVWVLRTFFV